jgi:hypothetical protein
MSHGRRLYISCALIRLSLFEKFLHIATLLDIDINNAVTRRLFRFC